jgi:hypothetical protein
VKKRIVMKNAAATRARRKLSIVPSCSSSPAKNVSTPAI